MGLTKAQSQSQNPNRQVKSYQELTMYYRRRELSFSSFAAWIRSILRGNKGHELTELNERIDCLQRAVANLTKLVAEDRELLS